MFLSAEALGNKGFEKNSYKKQEACQKVGTLLALYISESEKTSFAFKGKGEEGAKEHPRHM